MRYIQSISLTVLTALIGCSNPSATNTNPTPLIPSARVVDVAEAIATPLTRNHRYAGVVRASHRAELAFTLSGRVIKRPAQIGATVSKGQVLAVIDRRPLRNALTAARAQRATLAARLAQSSRDTERAQTLRNAEAIGSEELEKTKSGQESLRAQLAAADANVAETRRLLGETSLRAPFAGTIVDVRIQPGEFAQPGRPAILISGEQHPEVEIEVPDNLRHLLSVGASALVEFPLSNRLATHATIKRVGRASAGVGRLIPVVIALNDQADDKNENENENENTIAAGQTAEVIIQTTLPVALTVPVAAILDPSGSRPAVFRVKGDIANVIPVDLGAIIGDRVVVRKGLTSGDIIVVGGHANLVNGEKVVTHPTNATPQITGRL